jgi:hypothetical protein
MAVQLAACSVDVSAARTADHWAAAKGAATAAYWDATRAVTKVESRGNKSVGRKADMKDDCSAARLGWKRAAQKAARWDAYSAGTMARRTAVTRAGSMDKHWAAWTAAWTAACWGGRWVDMTVATLAAHLSNLWDVQMATSTAHCSVDLMVPKKAVLLVEKTADSMGELKAAKLDIWKAVQLVSLLVGSMETKMADLKVSVMVARGVDYLLDCPKVKHPTIPTQHHYHFGKYDDYVPAAPYR